MDTSMIYDLWCVIMAWIH